MSRELSSKLSALEALFEAYRTKAGSIEESSPEECESAGECSRALKPISNIKYIKYIRYIIYINIIYIIMFDINTIYYMIHAYI